MKFSNMLFVVCVLVVAVLSFGTTASSQILVEDFNYSSGINLNGQGGWTAHSGAGTNPPQIALGSLSYTGYPGSGIGNAVSFTTNGEDDNKLFAAYPDGFTSGSLYYSVMVRLDSVATAGDYFFHFYKNSSTFSARIFAKRASNGNIRFGIGRSSTAANISYSDSIYTVGTTYLMVAKYTSIAGATNDTVALWINPPIGGPEPSPTVLESAADRTTADVDTIYGIAIRQGSAANAAIGKVDGIRIDNAWPLGGGGPLTGTKTIPGTYPSLAAAIVDLNTQGVGPGGVTFNVAAGYTETITATLSVTATGASADPIVFRKSGAGSNPLITAFATGTGTPSTAIQDGLWQLVGSDYVTINGIDLLDPNVTNPATMEYGYALYKTSATDGCQNVTIQNCTITLSRENNGAGSGPAVDGSRGIDVVNALPTAATTALTVTAASGANSNNKFYHNTIQNCNVGIAVIGFADVTPFTFADQNNDIGGSSAATGNTIKNYGGATGAVNPAAAIRTLAQYGINITYNTINSNDGGGVSHLALLRGIYNNTATSASATISNNTITVVGGGTTSALTAIENAAGSTAAGNSVSMTNNTITNCAYPTATSGTFTGILSSASAATVNISGNALLNNATSATSGQTTLISNTGAATVAINIDGNTVNGMTFNVATSGALVCFNNSGGAATAALSISGNSIQGISYPVASTASHTYISNTASTLSQGISGNTFNNLNVNTTGSITFITCNVSLPATGIQNVNGNSIVTAFTKGGAGGTVTFFTSNASSVAGSIVNNNGNNFSNVAVTGATTIAGWSNTDGGAPSKTIAGNSFRNITGGTSAITLMNVSFGADVIFGNTISNVTGGSTITGIFRGSSGTISDIYSNSIDSLFSTGAVTVTGISYGAPSGGRIYKNKISSLQADNAAGVVSGMTLSGGLADSVFNNLVGDLRAPSTSSATDAIRGINITSTTSASVLNISYNTIYLNGTSVGTNFSSSGLFHTTSATATTAALVLRNNVIVNSSVANGTGVTSAYRRSSTALANYASTSDNNDFYAGTPGAANVIFFDGTNADQTMAAFKARVAPREVLSFTENPPFVSTVGSSPSFLHINTSTPTQIESGGQPIAGITDDYDGDLRSATNPDVGADEFAGIPIDLNPPTITYTPLLNGGVVATRTLATSIGDVSGVQRNTAGEPRIYYKKGVAGTYVEAAATSIVGTTFTFTITHANIGGVAAGDTIFYYVGAQDSLNNTGTNPLGGSGINPPGNVPPTSPNFYRIITIVSSFPYVQDFESGPGGWESGIFSGSVNDWVLGTPAKTTLNGAHSGTKAWVTAVTGLYQNNENAYVQSPVFDFSSLTNDPLLSLWHVFKTEATWDAGIIEYSTDGGTTFNRLGVLNDPAGRNWYNNSSTNGPISPPKWSGNSSDFGTGYINSLRPLTGLAGRPSVILRFRFGSDGSGQDEGWAFDDISITTPPLKDIQVLSASVAPPSPQVGTPITVSAVIKNNGIESDPASVSLTYKANAVPADSADGTVQVFAPTWSGHQANVTFTTTYSPGVAGNLTMWVRSFYPGDGDSTNDRASATANVLPTGTVLGENFSGTTFPPTGWAISSTSTTIGWGRFAATQSDGSAGFSARENFWSQGSGVRDTLKTPVMDLSSLKVLSTAKALAFDHAYRFYSPTALDSVRIELSTNGGGTWPYVLYFDGSPNITTNTGSGEFTPGAASDWRHHAIRIPDSLLTGTVQVSFIGLSQFGNDYWLDNVQISTIPDTDYAVISVAQINGIPTPFRPINLRLSNNKSKMERQFVADQRGVQASHVNNSIMLDEPGVPSRDRVKSYVSGSLFDESQSAFSINAQKPDTLSGIVQNVGITSPTYSFEWTLDGVGQTPIPRPGIPFLAYDTVALNISPSRRGTLTATGLANVANDHDPSNNSKTTYRVLSYPDTPVVRIRYDNGTNAPSTFIGFGTSGLPTTAGVRFHATSNMRLANIDAFYRNEGTPDSVVVQVWAAGVDTTAPGILLSTQRFGGLNYNSTDGDYFTLPLPSNAPAFAAGSDYWVSVRFVPTVQFPAGAQSTGISAGHSYISADSGRTWFPLVISTTEYAWLLRTVAVPAVPSGPVVSGVARSTRVPNAGDTVAVTATILDSLGVTSTSLMYAIDGVAQTPLPMTRVSGTPQNGSYRAVIPGSASTNGARIEYQIRAVSASGLTTTTAVTANNSYFAGLSPISLSGVKAIAPNGQNLYVNYYAKVTGTISGPNFQAGNGNLSYYFQDATGGINLFFFASPVPVLTLGDSVTVIGKIAQFRGTTELTPDNATNDITLVANGRTVTPIALTLAQLNGNPELYESRLITLTSLRRVRATPPWPPAGSNASIIMYQTVLTDTINMFLDLDTQIPGSPEPAYPVNVTGVTGQFTSSVSVYNDGYEIIPRYLTDFVSPPPALSGSYTVGSGGNFPTLDSAFAALGRVGVIGPVTFSLTDSLYAPSRGGGSGDSQPIARGVAPILDSVDPLAAFARAHGKAEVTNGTDDLDVVSISLTGPISGASATNRITIRPATGVRARISGTGAATFNFLNVSYVTFDGIGTTGGTQLAVENTASGGVAIALLGNSDNDVVQNLTLSAPYASGIAVYMDTASLAAPDSNQVLSNVIRSAYFGMYVRGGNYTSHGTRIMNNRIGSATDSIGAVGIYNQQVAGNIIANNTIQNVKDAVAAGGNIAGMWIATRQSNMSVYNNVINGVRNRAGATGAVFAAGIYHFGTAGDTTRSKFYNNMISGLDNPSTSASATVRGMYLSTAIQDTAVFNSVYVTGTDAAGILSGALYASSASVGLTLKDNIAINARVATGTGRAMGLYVSATPTGLTSNYNDLYVPTQTGSNVAAIGTTNYATLAAWQATGRDSQSVSVMANFVAPDLHIDSTVSTPLNGGARPVAGVTTDIDGQTRNASTPDIGADEFNAPPPPTPGWTAQTSGITVQFYSVKAVSQTVAWAAALGGRVLRTVTGGNTWTSVGGGHIGAADIYNIEATSGNTAFVTTTPGVTYIFRTTNGGTSWDTVYTLGGTGAFIDAIKMQDANNGIALGDPVGGKWTIVRTSNGGATWVRDTVHAPLQVSGEAGNQGDLVVVGSNIWFGSSANGRVYRSTDGGTTWLSSTVPGATAATNVIAVWFDSPQYGIASAVTGTTYTAYRSTDGGVTWSSITVGTGGYNIAVSGSGTDDFWMASGTDVYRSTNRGVTWAQSYTGTGTFYDVDFFTTGSNTYGWGVKDNGNIVAAYFIISSVNEQPEQVPHAFALMQNYPNPFNPTTTLRYSLPKDARVTLTIYNILGQRIATLRDEMENVGFYDVVWNGRNDFGSPIASGVYFYRIEARPTDGSETFSSIKKMLMLK